MADERAGDFHWKRKIDQLSSLPGEAAAGREDTWQRLHSRLQQKKRETRKAGYWMAAAPLLLSVMLSWLMWQPAGRQPILNDVARLPAAAVSTHPQAAPIQDTVQIVASRAAARKMVPLAPKNKAPLSAAASHLPVHTPEMVQEPVRMVTVEAVPKADTTSLATAVLPVQKKMRVVHINELGNALPETLMVRRNGAPYLQEKLPGQEDLSRVYTGHNTSDDILKIKLSSSN